MEFALFCFLVPGFASAYRLVTYYVLSTVYYILFCIEGLCLAKRRARAGLGEGGIYRQSVLLVFVSTQLLSI